MEYAVKYSKGTKGLYNKNTSSKTWARRYAKECVEEFGKVFIFVSKDGRYYYEIVESKFLENGTVEIFK